MIEILEYITQNYTSILVVLVLILLAIIGYYADKTNFGQGKNKENKFEEIKQPKELVEDIDTKIIDIANNNDAEKQQEVMQQKEIQEEQKQQEKVENIQKENVNQEVVNYIQVHEQPIINEEIKNKELEEIESLLPKKELINNDLLNEIDGMELNSLKGKTTINVPDLDDISLPKIKNLVEREQDIWKF